jgi:2'-5' RNA ligase
VRAFVAVYPPSEARRALVEAAQALDVVGEVRWTRPERAHLTLKFLGDVAEEDLGPVAKTLEPVCLRHEPFEARPSSFGAFPSTRRARIVWAGIGEGSEPLRALAEDVETSLEPLGFEREGRTYVPHLTLGRARGRPVSLEVVETPPAVLGFIVRNVELVESVLGGEPTYSTLATFPLSEGRD